MPRRKAVPRSCKLHRVWELSTQGLPGYWNPRPCPRAQVWLCMDRHLRPTPCHPHGAAAAEARLQRGRRCAHLRMPPLRRPRASLAAGLLGALRRLTTVRLPWLLPGP